MLRCSADARGGKDSSKSSLIKSIANQLVIHLRSLPAVLVKPQAVLELSKLADFDTLYGWALLENQKGSKKEEIPEKMRGVLGEFGLSENDIPEKSRLYIQSAISTIYKFLRRKCLNKLPT
jgi:hypothetical protein